MSGRESFYLGLPEWLQVLVFEAEAIRVKRRRYCGAFFAELKDAEKRLSGYREPDSADLDRFWAEGVQSASHYRSLAAGCQGLREFIERAPILLKSEVREKCSEFRGMGIVHRFAHTSGTTGGGLVFPVTAQAEHRQWATWWRFRRRHGISFETWCGYLGGRTICPATSSNVYRVGHAVRQVHFSLHHLSRSSAQKYVSEIRQRGLPWLHGYPSFISLLAQYILDIGLDPGKSVKIITTGAEKLLQHQRESIQKAFGVNPIQHYGMAEGVANASECRLGKLHIDEDFSLVELVPTARENTYRIVGTNVTNTCFPLVRYDTGDLASVFSGDTCNCGSAGRIIHGIDGRIEDSIVLRDGAVVGRMDHIFKDAVRVREAQVFQDTIGKIEIRIVRGVGFGASDERSISDALFARFGDRLNWDFVYVPELPRSKSGKFRFVISTVRI